MAHQALYRRYRPSCFAELRGQESVVRALQNAVRQGRVGHAYLFSGPRGTGKTSTARILAKALNCTDSSSDGEPCGRCQSCIDIAGNTSYDLIELDAASNNKVDDIRDLISRVAMGSPGKAKVYVLDEVHMLTSGAENALLKTLEEPPDHVVFVLCTTEPHKVVPTIRSRTQHLEFSLIDGDVLADHARWIIEQAGLEVDGDAINHAVHRGAGSARDTLSALEQIVNAGGVTDRLEAVDTIIEALGSQDYGPAFTALHETLRSGREPRIIGEALLDRLRNAFLSAMGADLNYLTDAQQADAHTTAGKLSPARLTRSLEVLGTALVDMRQAPDPRVDLEVALARLTRRDLDTDVAALLERVERLEHHGPQVPISETGATSGPAAPPSSGQAHAPTSGHERARAKMADIQARQAKPKSPSGKSQPSPTGSIPTSPAEPGAPIEGASDTSVPDPGQGSGGVDPAQDRARRPTLGAIRAASTFAPQTAVVDGSESDSSTEPETMTDTDISTDAETTTDTHTPTEPDISTEPETTTDTHTQAAGSGAAVPSREEMTLAWGDTILADLPQKARSRFQAGRFLTNDDGYVVFALPHQIHLDRCEEVRESVDKALSAHFGRPVPMRLTIDDNSTAPPPNFGVSTSSSIPTLNDENQIVDPNELMDEETFMQEAISNLMAAFPGSELVTFDPPSTTNHQG
ncbi:DNA polymerase III subunit gamma/tau [Candidatus Poriferisocius sp.]|uniref:DNA polymerase III subunit gamma/tau n=1 Tax=Candidatus Poriferisocius sp. TaxID=3101276 RepID=UPI003B01218C